MLFAFRTQQIRTAVNGAEDPFEPTLIEREALRREWAEANPTEVSTTVPPATHPVLLNGKGAGLKPGFEGPYPADTAASLIVKAQGWARLAGDAAAILQLLDNAPVGSTLVETLGGQEFIINRSKAQTDFDRCWGAVNGLAQAVEALGGLDLEQSLPDLIDEREARRRARTLAVPQHWQVRWPEASGASQAA